MPEPDEKQIEQLLKSAEDSVHFDSSPRYVKGGICGLLSGLFGFGLIMLLLTALGKLSLWSLAALVGALLFIITGMLVAFRPRS